MTTRALEAQEIQRVFASIDGAFAARNETLLLVGIGMALRATELVSLQVGDVWDGRAVKTHVTIRAETAKFGKEREVRMWDAVQEGLTAFLAWKGERRESLALDVPLFVSRKSGHLTRQALFHIVRGVFRRVGIEQSPHALRKTGATIFYLASDCDLIATQQFLGHASPSTTRTYIGIPSYQIQTYSEASSQWLKHAMAAGEFKKGSRIIEKGCFWRLTRWAGARQLSPGSCWWKALEE